MADHVRAGQTGGSKTRQSKTRGASNTVLPTVHQHDSHNSRSRSHLRPTKSEGAIGTRNQDTELFTPARRVTRSSSRQSNTESVSPKPAKRLTRSASGHSNPESLDLKKASPFQPRLEIQPISPLNKSRSRSKKTSSCTGVSGYSFVAAERRGRSSKSTTSVSSLESSASKEDSKSTRKRKYSALSSISTASLPAESLPLRRSSRRFSDTSTLSAFSTPSRSSELSTSLNLRTSSSRSRHFSGASTSTCTSFETLKNQPREKASGNPSKERARKRSKSRAQLAPNLSDEETDFPCKRTRSKTSLHCTSLFGEGPKLEINSAKAVSPKSSKSEKTAKSRIGALSEHLGTLLKKSKKKKKRRSRGKKEAQVVESTQAPLTTVAAEEEERKSKQTKKSRKRRKSSKVETVVRETRGHVEKLASAARGTEPSTSGSREVHPCPLPEKRARRLAGVDSDKPAKHRRGRKSSTRSDVQNAAGRHSTSKTNKKSKKKKTTGTCPSTRSSRQAAGSSSRTSSQYVVAQPGTSSQQSKVMSAPGESKSDEQTAGTSQSATNSGGSGTTNGASASVPVTGAMAFPPDADTDEADMGRLQALLEARGLPTHLFGALGPRMHQLLHRSMAGGQMGKAQQLLTGLQAAGDEGTQLTSVIEMCQLLVMGNEDTLAGFPVKQVVPALITLLKMEHNFDMMHHACRALTYMMEALPRSSAVVVDAVPTFLEKLQSIQCMDVAEQSLQALEMLSRRHGKTILQAGGIAACLTYLDFFSITAQRAALGVTANCCHSLNSDEFQHIRDNLALLSGRLGQQDKKSVENVCRCFSLLVDDFQADERVLKEIAAHGLLNSIQQLLMMTPPLISTGTFVTVIRMLVIMCASCPDLAVVLHKQNIADALCYLLVGTSEAAASIELVQRTPQELYEIVSLIGELMPKLPTDGIFNVDNYLKKSTAQSTDAVLWQWKDDRSMWHPYTPIDSRIVEAAYQAGEDEVGLSTMGRTYSVDFNSMHQINEDTGTSRTVQRKANPLAAPASVTAHRLLKSDSRADMMADNPELASGFIKTLFCVLYEVYSSSAGPAVRHKCLQALLRMIYYAPNDLLKQVLSNISVSSHIAAMMASQDLKAVVCAIQMALILIDKLPDIFSVYFRREGVMHQLKKLSEMERSALVTPKRVTPSAEKSSPTTPMIPGVHTSHAAATSDVTGEKMDVTVTMAAATPLERTSPCPSPPMRLSDVLKRKKPPKRSTRKGTKSMEEEALAAASAKSNTSATRNSTPPTRKGKDKSSGATPKTSFLASLNPSRWGRSSSNTSDRAPNAPARESSSLLKSPLTPSASINNKEKVREWIKQNAVTFSAKHFSAETPGGADHPALDILNRLCTATDNLLKPDCDVNALREIADIMCDSDVSPFEIIHSGIVGKLLKHLTTTDLALRDLRIRQFLHVFLLCPPPDVTKVGELDRSVSPPIASLVNKLMACFHHLEQFQVKVHDLPGSSRGAHAGSNALRFFNTHQLKCHLQRHTDCKTLKQWKGGPVKIDPLALVQAIERYLVMRGYGRSKNDIDDDLSDDDASDDDIDDTMAAVSISQGTSGHRLEFLIGDRVLPYNMTVYQAIKQFSHTASQDGSETDTDAEHPYGSAGIWVHTHTIWYRVAPEQEHGRPDTASSPKKTKSEKGGKGANKSKKDQLWTGDGVCPSSVTALEAFLTAELPAHVTVKDPSVEVLALLRILHALNRDWSTLYESRLREQVLDSQQFLSSKLTAKANRQLQDPLVIMTGNMPNWLSEIGIACPFLLPFDTRQMLFYATSFDRDRAMHRLQDSAPDSAPLETSDRVTPRLEKRKRIVNREEILKQAEKVLEELGSTRAMLEIQYQDEVGTGLGPTLEFYALVSRDLQRADLDLWRGEPVKTNDLKSDEATYMFNSTGLFPAPVGRSTKAAALNKIKTKFKFLGKFMAKAIMDFRMLDLPLSRVFYKWLLGEEHTLTCSDLVHLDPVLAKSYNQLDELLRHKHTIENDKSHTPESRQLALDSLTMDGCSIEDLSLDFVLPGYPSIELKKGGKDLAVTLQNLDEYLKLVSHWTLVEGVAKQFESLREGFESVFSLSCLSTFYPEELEKLFCGSTNECWDTKYLIESCRPDHGYTHDSRAVRNLFEILSSYTPEEQRQFLQFVTGSPRLPVGGLKSLSPPLTVVRKTFESHENADEFLPSVMTCVNYLKLPEYSTLDIMRHKLNFAAQEGQFSFHLS